MDFSNRNQCHKGAWKWNRERNLLTYAEKGAMLF